MSFKVSYKVIYVGVIRIWEREESLADHSPWGRMQSDKVIMLVSEFSP